MFIFNAAMMVLAGLLGMVVDHAGLHGDGLVGGFIGLVVGALIVYVFQPRRN